jgi:signal transduction histidine kinase
VIETFIVDWPILSILGLAFGAFAPRHQWWRSRAFAAGLVSATVFTAIALVSYVIAPDWMWMYFVDPAEVSWSVPLVLVAYLVVFALSFAAAVALRDIGTKLVMLAIAAGVLMEVTVVAVTWERYHLIGTREEWASGAAHDLFALGPTGPARTISLLGPVFLVTLVASGLAVWRQRRPERP